MILKDKNLINATDPRAVAGQEQEKNVAFYLRRAFKDDKKVLVINDLAFSHNGENAQIDHLIIYPYGFILIESKSITGEVKVNSHGEWSRTVGSKWTGMPSPIKQVELQQKLLREYLFEHRESILPKLFGIMTQSFGMRKWDNLCAVSSNSIIERDQMPADLSNQIVKSEFIADKVKEVMKLKNKVIKSLTLDTRPDFSPDEMTSIASFLLKEPDSDPTPWQIPEVKRDAISEDYADKKEKPALSCKNCGESKELIPQYGRYGYYVNCKKCEANTSMKMPCPKCGSKNIKVFKRQELYRLACNDCQESKELIQAGS